MVLNGTWNEHPFTIAVRSDGLTISIGEPAAAQVYSYDLAGRLWSVFAEGVSFRRGLDGKIFARWREPGRPRERRWLTSPEALDIERSAYTAIQSLQDAINNGSAQLYTPLPQEASHTLQTELAFDERQSRLNVQIYHQIYKPIGILPPDQYMSVVLQVTEGCSFNTCTFCDFYKNRPFRIKTPEDLREHIVGIKGLLAEGFSLRRSIFLADANALVMPMSQLLPLLDVVHAGLDIEALGGLYAFLDGFSGEKKSSEDYAKLRLYGLRRVYLGLESGSNTLLRFLNKPGTAEQAIQAVRSMKTAGVTVGVVVLLGAGGKEHAPGHIADTIAAVNAMELDSGDILYLSELVIGDSMPYAGNALDAGLSPLTGDELIQQGYDIVSGLRFAHQGTPRISRYDIREFVY